MRPTLTSWSPLSWVPRPTSSKSSISHTPQTRGDARFFVAPYPHIWHLAPSQRQDVGVRERHFSSIARTPLPPLDARFSTPGALRTLTMCVYHALWRRPVAPANLAPGLGSDGTRDSVRFRDGYRHCLQVYIRPPAVVKRHGDACAGARGGAAKTVRVMSSGRLTHAVERCLGAAAPGTGARSGRERMNTVRCTSQVRRTFLRSKGVCDPRVHRASPRHTARG